MEHFGFGFSVEFDTILWLNEFLTFCEPKIAKRHIFSLQTKKIPEIRNFLEKTVCGVMCDVDVRVNELRNTTSDTSLFANRNTRFGARLFHSH